MQIHELNSFVGTPSNSDYLAIDDGATTTKVPATSLGVSTAMTQAEAEAGTETAPRVISPAVLNSFVEAQGNEIIQELSANKVLWTGAFFMIATQTITLSESISAQNKGIVLCWSAYENEAAQDYDWVYHFVPKWHISVSNGSGVDFFLNTLNTAGHKYLYISDTSIRGYASNSSSSATGTNSKIVYKNNYWALRAVLGV